MAQAELLKRQEELERKAAELDRREREMQNLSQHGNIQGRLKYKCLSPSRSLGWWTKPCPVFLF